MAVTRQSDGTYRNEYNQTTDSTGNVINTTTAPGTQSGSGTYGSIAGATTLPSAYADLSSVYPKLSATNTAASNAVLSDLSGTLSSTTSNAIRDAANAYGFSNYGGGSNGLTNNLTLRDIGLTSEGQKAKGLTEYGNLASTLSKTQTVSPETQISLSQSNNALSAQANPQDATNYALSLYNSYLSKLSSSGSSTTGASTPTVRTNSGGSGTTSPFQVTGTTATPSAPGGGSGAGVTNSNTGTTGAYTPVTGNTYGGFDSTDPTNPTSGAGTTYMGAADGSSNYDWEALLSEYGI